LDALEREVVEQEKALSARRDEVTSQKAEADVKFKEREAELSTRMADLKRTMSDATGTPLKSAEEAPDLEGIVAEKKAEIERLRGQLQTAAEMEQREAEVRAALDAILADEGEYNKRANQVQIEEDQVRDEEEAIEAERDQLASEKQSQELAEKQANKFLQVYADQLKKGEAEYRVILQKIEKLRNSMEEK
jgi:hypothetical protein